MTTPYKFQKIGIKKINRFGGRALLADEMGLGKSFQALLYAWTYLPSDIPIVIVCPANLKENWKREATKHLDMESIILYSKKPCKIITKEMKKNVIYIINYDILGSALDNKPTWNKFLRKLKPKLIIIDECHAIANLSAKRTKNTRQLCHKIPHVIALSGTPLTNRPAELWPVLNILQPALYPNFPRYAQRYCKPEYTPWGIQYRGATRLDELHSRLKNEVMIRRLKQDVLDDLPEKQTIIIPVQCKGIAEYQLAEKDFITWLRRTHPDRANRSRNAERLVQYGYLLRLAARLKIPAIKEWIDSFLLESDSKLIVFGVHKEMMHGLHNMYSGNSVKIDGGTDKLKRMGYVDEFLNKKQTRILFGNIKAAGSGWSAPGVSDTLFVELGWTPGELNQAKDRTHGIGRGDKNKVSTSYILVAKDTVEEAVCKLLQDKQKNSDSILDGLSEDVSVPGTLNIYDQLENAILNKDK